MLPVQSSEVVTKFWPDVFDVDSQYEVSCPYGPTLREIIDAGSWPVPVEASRVVVGGWAVPPEMLDKVRPKAGMVVTVRPQLMGIGGAIAAVVAAIKSITLAGVLKTIGYLALSYGASLLTASLVKPPSQKGAGGISTGRSGSATLRDLGNEVRRGDPIPDAYGKYRVYPPFGAFPFTESVGGQPVSRLLFLVSHGPCRITDLRFGETPLSNFEGVETEIREGWPTDPPRALFKETVLEDPVELRDPFVVLPASSPNWSRGPEVIRATFDSCVEIGLLFDFFGGISNTSYKGQFWGGQVKIEIKYRKQGDVTWINAVDEPSFRSNDDGYSTVGVGQSAYGDTDPTGENGLLVEGRTRDPFLVGCTWQTPEAAIYEVRVTRIESLTNVSRPGGQYAGAPQVNFVWKNIKTFIDTDPIQVDNVATVSIRFPVGEQVAGVVSNFNCIVERYLPIYDPLDPSADAHGWTTDPKLTRNAASVFRNIFLGSSNPNPVDEDQVDWDSLNKWYQNNDIDGRTFDAYIDSLWTAYELARDVARASRADFNEKDGRVSIIEDREQLEPKALIVPRNVMDFEYETRFPQIPNALKGQYEDEKLGYDTQSQVIVYDEGFDEFGSGGNQAAKLFETIRLFGITDHDLATKDLRRYLASLSLRPRTFTVEQDLESITYKRGDFVLFAHDQALIGTAWGFIAIAGLRITFDGLDDVVGWTNSQCDMVVDTTTVREPTGSMRTENPLSTDAYVEETTSYGSLNFKESGFLVDVRISDGVGIGLRNGVNIRFTDGAGRWSQWSVGTLDGLPDSGADWGTVVLDLRRAPDLIGSTGPADLGTIAEIRFYPFAEGFVSTSRVWFDDMRVIFTGSGTVDTLVCENAMRYTDGVDYRAQIRVPKPDGTTKVHEAPIVNHAAGGLADVTTELVYLQTAITDPNELPSRGDLMAMGTSGVEVIEAIVDQVARNSDLEAKVVLQDYAREIYQLDSGPIPPFDPAITYDVKPTFRSPESPEVVQIIADEQALSISESGTLIPRIILVLKPLTDGTKARVAEIDVHIRFTSMLFEEEDPDGEVDPSVGDTARARWNQSGDWKQRDPFEATADRIILDNVVEGETYDIKLASVTADGLRSDWVFLPPVKVIGRTSPPPDLTSLRLENEHLIWDLDVTPIDFAGIEIRSYPGLEGSWEAATPLSSEVITHSPVSVSSVPRGVRTFLARTVDTSGNLSVGIKSLARDLGDIFIANVLAFYDEHADGFPGTKTNMTVDGTTGDLENDDAGGLFWPQPDSVLFWPDDSELLWDITFLTGSYVTSIGLAVDELPGGITTEIVVEDADYSVEYATFPFTLINPLDTDASNWTGVGTTPADETTVVNEGAGSLRLTTTGVAGTERADRPFGGDLTDFVFAIDVQATDAAGLSATDGVRVRFTDNVGGWIEYHYGTDDGVAVGRWTTVYADMSRAPDATSGAFDKTNTVTVSLYHNVVSPANGRIAYFDAIRLVSTADPEWSLWPGRLDNVTTVPIITCFRLVVAGGSTQGKVSTFVISKDVPDVTEFLPAVAVAATQTRLPITKQYRVIVAVVMTLWDPNADAGIAAQIVDKNPTLGPLVQIKNRNNQLVAGTVDAQVIGY